MKRGIGGGRVGGRERGVEEGERRESERSGVGMG